MQCNQVWLSIMYAAYALRGHSPGILPPLQSLNPRMFESGRGPGNTPPTRFHCSPFHESVSWMTKDLKANWPRRQILLTWRGRGVCSAGTCLPWLCCPHQAALLRASLSQCQHLRQSCLDYNYHLLPGRSQRSANQRPVARSRDHSQLIRGQRSAQSHSGR